MNKKVLMDSALSATGISGLVGVLLGALTWARPGFSNGEPLLLVMLLAFIWLGAFGFGYMFMRDMTSMARVMEEARKNPAAIESVDLKECDNGVLAVMVTMRDAQPREAAIGALSAVRVRDELLKLRAAALATTPLMQKSDLSN